MAAKGAQLQAYFARKREQEHQHVQRTQAVSRYYDHWDKQTTRYGNWTTPEYYKQAEAASEKRKTTKEKEKTLNARQEKLRELYAKEKFDHEEEMRCFEKKRFKHTNVSTEQLQKTEERVRDQERIKRKLEMEAKLYGKWRYGIDDDSLLFDTKSEHKTLAKLNWLDKQIEEQMLHEKDQALAQERNLRLQEETRRIEELQKERQQIREKEIKEIRGFQDSHMERIALHKAESDVLKDLESDLKYNLKDLEKQKQLLEQSTAALQQRKDISKAYNLNKIKVHIRQRSEVYRKQIQLNIDMLQRVHDYGQRGDAIEVLLHKYKADLEQELRTVAQIDAMYESEAKYNLQRCEDLWHGKNMERYAEVKKLLDSEYNALTVKLEQNLNKQSELVDLRSTLLTAVDNSNEKLKQLIEEEAQSPRARKESYSARSIRSQSALPVPPLQLNVPNRPNSSSSMKDLCTDKQKLSDSFSNLNLVSSQNLPASSSSCDSHSVHSASVITADNAERPRFGRKRVAWT